MEERQVLDVEWRGEHISCKASMKVLMMIEERVPLGGLANRMRDPENVPVTHLLWCVYCVLRGSGARVTDDEVWSSFRDGDLKPETMQAVISWLLSEAFGVAPESDVEEEVEPGEC